ncbi:29a81c0a-47a1-4c97-b51f-11b2ad5e67b6 [Thermothielavioides terrestris]|uniref:29a81c0a-47a1-4c97-b51f-11b2ad5e67b6 n=1 Tax=Thermothielavioides terrestris TaxID=2587410 RepID=A0A3S4F1J9_9PEZI|nr:29a81c0a-47a1-4c97-b51f-11b2ad5e67b6 [Thermothielavioides terrestris]
MPTCAIVRLPLLVEEAPSESTATHSEDDAEVTEDEPEGSDDDAGDYASDEDDVATEPHLIPELKETRISRGYSRRPTKAGNKYIATMSEALARARADFGHDPEYMAKLATHSRVFKAIQILFVQVEVGQMSVRLVLMPLHGGCQVGRVEGGVVLDDEGEGLSLAPLL